MTTEQVKALLSRYATYDEQISRAINDMNIQKAHINAIIEDVADIGAVNNDGMPRGSGISDKTYRAVEKIDELTKTFEKRIDKLRKQIDRIYRRKAVIEDVIERQLNATEECIFYEKYVEKNMEKNVLRGYTRQYKKKMETSLLEKMRVALEQFEKENQ